MTEWNVKEIEIAVKNLKTEKTAALVCDDIPGLAIHVVPGDFPQQWNVTHVESGRVVWGGLEDEDYAKRAAKWLFELALDWTLPFRQVEVEARNHPFFEFLRCVARGDIENFHDIKPPTTFTEKVKMLRGMGQAEVNRLWRDLVFGGSRAAENTFRAAALEAGYWLAPDLSWREE